ncbi:hypothetical protein CKJ81_11595 [Corynebacterium hadale]|uniref:Uncharacterized protein n=1 Tax=Corynebacterium hadale TaxID=2026255 RepID=A0ABX4H721_9CORY|nr:hypothetical protein CKJ81_11595 [Corynebacterium hadale]
MGSLPPERFTRDRRTRCEPGTNDNDAGQPAIYLTRYPARSAQWLSQTSSARGATTRKSVPLDETNGHARRAEHAIDAGDHAVAGELAAGLALAQPHLQR